jgi:hypothetical protein
MGFDLSGLNPNLTRPEPELPPFPERTSEDWEIYTDWQEENCGTYFRNNVWSWRPLWHFVTAVCDNILTEKDIKSGSYNDGHKISKTKARRIAKRLHRMIESGEVKEYEEGYKKHLASLEQDDWERSYPFDEDNVRQFANFCANSGGFKIC